MPNDRVSTVITNTEQNNNIFSKGLCLIAHRIYGRKLGRGARKRLWLTRNTECCQLDFVINWRKATQALSLETMLLIVTILKRIGWFSALESLLNIADFHQSLQMRSLFIVIPSRSNLHSSGFFVPWEIWSSQTVSVGFLTSSLLLYFWPKAYTCRRWRKGAKEEAGYFSQAYFLRSGEEVMFFCSSYGYIPPP